MRNIIGISAALLLATAGATASAAPFALTSADFKNGGTIGQKNAGNIMGCTGDSKSPALEWKNPPAGTKSFALMVHDPDAPTGARASGTGSSTTSPRTRRRCPKARATRPAPACPRAPSRATPTWASPATSAPARRPAAPSTTTTSCCYPLKVDKLDVPPGATAAYVGFNANANVIGKPAKLTGMYARPKEAAAPKAPPAEPKK